MTITASPTTNQLSTCFEKSATSKVIRCKRCERILVIIKVLLCESQGIKLAHLKHRNAHVLFTTGYVLCPYCKNIHYIDSASQSCELVGSE